MEAGYILLYTQHDVLAEMIRVALRKKGGLGWVVKNLPKIIIDPNHGIPNRGGESTRLVSYGKADLLLTAGELELILQ